IWRGAGERRAGAVRAGPLCPAVLPGARGPLRRRRLPTAVLLPTAAAAPLRSRLRLLPGATGPGGLPVSAAVATRPAAAVPAAAGARLPGAAPVPARA